MKAIAIIEGAIAKLTALEWTQGATSLDEGGCWVDPHSTNLHSVCAWGALAATVPTSYASLSGEDRIEAETAEAAIARAIHETYPPEGAITYPSDVIVKFNDKVAKTEEDVIVVFERAIEILKAAADPATVSVTQGGIGDTHGFFLPPDEDTHSVRV